MISIEGSNLTIEQRNYPGAATLRVVGASPYYNSVGMLCTKREVKRAFDSKIFAKCTRLSIALSSKGRCGDLGTIVHAILDHIGPQISGLHVYDLESMYFVTQRAQKLTGVRNLTVDGNFRMFVRFGGNERIIYKRIGDLLEALPLATLSKFFLSYAMPKGPKDQTARCSKLLARFPSLERMSSSLYLPPVSNVALKEIVVAHGTLYTKDQHHHYQEVLDRMRGAPAMESCIVSVEPANSIVMREHVIRMERVVREYVRLCPRAKSLKSGHLDYDGPIRHLQAMLTILGAEYTTQTQRACVVHRVPADIFRVVKRFLDFKPVHALGDAVLF